MKVALLVAALPLAVSCASAPEASAPPEEKRFATGSNIPMRNRDVHTMTPEALEQLKNQSSANTGRGRGN